MTNRTIHGKQIVLCNTLNFLNFLKDIRTVPKELNDTFKIWYSLQI